jgi:hypothetical protein
LSGRCEGFRRGAYGSLVGSMDMVQASSFLEEALCDARVGPILLEQAGMRKNGGIDGKWKC